MLAAERLLEIGETFGEQVQSIVSHHKHVGRKENRQPSFETRLEEVMAIILRGH